jgi:hypothetical protein
MTMQVGRLGWRLEFQMDIGGVAVSSFLAFT